MFDYNIISIKTNDKNYWNMLPLKSSKFDFGITDPLTLASFSEIGGLSDHIKLLKELVIVPLLYPNIYSQFKIKPPRGVLFHGPPGTGKTMVAGALANECSRKINRRVSFFSRKGGDVLDKWVGESEENLRSLFRVAYQERPSLIFFDELDGLAPVRSARQDQVHSNIVATMLALMDGLDRMPGVVVLAATNRLDSIDPALRRPGRFDREIYFPLPSLQARREILQVYVNPWSLKPTYSFLNYLADISVGYSGSDLQALCSEAVMCCVRRTYPTIDSAPKLQVKPNKLKIDACDFIKARCAIIPAVHRLYIPVRRLSRVIEPLMQSQLEIFLGLINSRWPHFMQSKYNYELGSGRYAGRMLLVGDVGQGHNEHMVPAMLHALEHLPIHVLDMQTLYEHGAACSEEISIAKLKYARQNLPAIILIYRLDEWWHIIEESTRAVIVSLLEDVHIGLPLLIFGTSTKHVPSQLENYFSYRNTICLEMRNPTLEERQAFLKPVFMNIVCKKFINTMEYVQGCKSDNKERRQRPMKRKRAIDTQESSCKKRKLVYKYSTRKKSRNASYLNNIYPPRNSRHSTFGDGIETYYINDNFSKYDIFDNMLLTNGSEGFTNPTVSSESQNNYLEEVGSGDNGMNQIRALFERAACITTKDMAVMELESFYDNFVCKLNFNYKSSQELFKQVVQILEVYEKKESEPEKMTIDEPIGA